MKFFRRNKSNTCWEELEIEKYSTMFSHILNTPICMHGVLIKSKENTCKGCGAPLKFNLNNCEYCGGII